MYERHKEGPDKESAGDASDLEDTREFTPEEVAALGLIADGLEAAIKTEKGTGGFQQGYPGRHDGTLDIRGGHIRRHR